MNNTLIVYGTRPEWIKIKPIVDLLDAKGYPHKLLFTGQHTTLVKEKFDRKITIIEEENRLDGIFRNILGKSEIFDDVDRVMVQGDTASAFAVAIAAFHRKIPVIHLEAGLRSHDIENPYPEEFYRRSISNLASINLCPTYDNYQNLQTERVSGKCEVVGNTSIDALLPYANKITTGGGCFVTLHRRENRSLMPQWITAIAFLSESSKIPFTFVSHPNFDVMRVPGIKNITVVPPLPHASMINAICSSDILISDSGGIQEEAAFFNKPLIVCRKTTERPESVGQTSFMCSHPDQLVSTFYGVLSMKRATPASCPFGDGHSSERIIKLLYE